LSREDIAKLGLGDIYNFDIDSEGNIYVLNGKPVEYFVFKFDRNGRFVKFFGRKGQGPGELGWTLSVGFDRRDPLDNEKFIAYWRKWTAPADDYFYDHFSLYDSGLKEIRPLDTCKVAQPEEIRNPGHPNESRFQLEEVRRPDLYRQ
jgi:hypothetical protein